jgi:hypothetical protein
MWSKAEQSAEWAGGGRNAFAIVAVVIKEDLTRF